VTTVAFISAATARLPAAEPTGVSDSGCMGVVTSTATLLLFELVAFLY
jgi:hypothetical protein